MRNVLVFGVLALCLPPGCATQECDFHSECGDGFYCTRGRCRQDCREDFDCSADQHCTVIGQCQDGPPPDGGPPDGGPGGFDSGPRDAGRPDAGPVLGMDAGPRPDAGVNFDAGGVESGPPLIDAGPPTGTRIYLDRCAVPGDCVSGLCELDVGGSRFCSRTCSLHSDCADEHICVSGRCLPDDTGVPCNPMSHSCSLYCFGNDIAGHCTRECNSAAECPAGYACVNGGPVRVCADIERPGGTCVTTMFFPFEGCTGDCRSNLDCPARYSALGLLPYTCGVPGGGTTPVCLPPVDTNGSDPIGTPCSTAGNDCRSSACNPDAVPGPAICTQTCNAEGGCARGYGCFAQDQGGGVFLPVCEVAGTGDIGAACSTRNDCDSGLCFINRCTRYCADGLCPTGWTCSPSGAAGIPNVCIPP